MQQGTISTKDSTASGVVPNPGTPYFLWENSMISLIFDETLDKLLKGETK